MKNAEWRDIPSFSGYQASNDWLVRSVDREVIDGRSGGTFKKVRGKVLAQYVGAHGYYTTCVKDKTRPVHRLVAAAFLGDFAPGMEVNHKNGVKTDNRLENLEMVTRSGNALHMYRTGLAVGPHKGKKGALNHLAKAVAAFKDGNEVMRFGAVREAEALGYDSGCISRAAGGIVKSHRGLQWKYME
jgi:hypothetical protein